MGIRPAKSLFTLFVAVALAMVSLTAAAEAENANSVDSAAYDHVIYLDQGADPQHVLNGFGPSADNALSIPGLGFQGYRARDQAVIGQNGISRFCDGADCQLVRVLTLPQGAVITSLRLYAADGNSQGKVILRLQKAELADKFSATVQSSLNTELLAGDLILTNENINLTIDNNSSFYYLDALITGGTFTTSIYAAQVLWKRRISPAPGTASFGDVTDAHPFFQSIEALASSGITQGCGQGNYCPDAAVTRGQMAVFLARALGL